MSIVEKIITFCSILVCNARVKQNVGLNPQSIVPTDVAKSRTYRTKLLGLHVLTRVTLKGGVVEVSRKE